MKTTTCPACGRRVGVDEILGRFELRHVLLTRDGQEVYRHASACCGAELTLPPRALESMILARRLIELHASIERALVRLAPERERAARGRSARLIEEDGRPSWPGVRGARVHDA